MQLSQKYEIKSFPKSLAQLLNWSRKFEVVCLLNNNQYSLPYQTQEILIAAGVKDEIILDTSQNAFSKLKFFIDRHSDKWILGFLNYDLKNDIENLHSNNPDNVQMPVLHFFIPKHLIEVKGGSFNIIYSDDKKQDIRKAILGCPVSAFQKNHPIKINSRMKYNDYVETVNKIQHHIKVGDIYELNFCQEFYAEQVNIDPFQTYLTLNRESSMPFSVFYKLYDKYLLCASPERFLKKENNQLISQPIKGTIKRIGDTLLDELQKNELYQNPKERAENIMIVDLVRNDLSKSAVAGTVKVNELCSIYSFPHLHQMISTVTANIKKNIHVVDCIKNAFPMGSMTGAPKVKAMELIEKYEKTKRGLFSGAVGYITPKMDFDFNVVIRSILYNSISQYLSYQVGSAITANSSPENEYEECLLKAEAIELGIRALGYLGIGVFGYLGIGALGLLTKIF